MPLRLGTIMMGIYQNFTLLYILFPFLMEFDLIKLDSKQHRFHRNIPAMKKCLFMFSPVPNPSALLKKGGGLIAGNNVTMTITMHLSCPKYDIDCIIHSINLFPL
jgi:hypothetical protein